MMKRKLNILIACEESQACCRAFRALGHNAYSCDLFKCSGTVFGTDIAEPHPEWHFDHDITTVLDKSNLILQNILKNPTLFSQKCNIKTNSDYI